MESNRSTGNSPTSTSSGSRPTHGLGEGSAAWTAAAASLALAIVLGAFGAHALEAALPADRLNAYGTASQYHFYSCFFLFALALTRAWLGGEHRAAQRKLSIAQALWGWGTVVFCGSVYLVSVRGIIGLESASWLGAIAPIGGTLLIAGAAYAAFAVLQLRR